ncbi:hypothetical protein HDU85_007536 [Gaertneriomyces sp. JEL0708]|nr:hypothetical protein HDU85_007536 [Gaertneriomyces sp. JEL0708]
MWLRRVYGTLPLRPRGRLLSSTTSSCQATSGPRTARSIAVGVGAFAVGITLYAIFPRQLESEAATSIAPATSATPGASVRDAKYPATLEIDGRTLPVVTMFTDDQADIAKPRLVILGSGWGATSLVKDLQANGYYTVIISPTNYFLFTPLLPEATTGTVEARSLLESIRYIARSARAHYCEAEAHDVHLDLKMVEVVGSDGKHFLVPYDKLVVAVGAMNNTFGVPGVAEHTHALKTISDARKLRYNLMKNFEHAALPTTSPEERRRLLSFVIAGGGPTGVEYAAELYDFLHNDLHKYFPELAPSVTVTIIQSGDHILNTFAEAISTFAEKRMKKQDINIVTNARVVKVDQDEVTYKLKNTDQLVTIPFGICVWSTGIGMRPFTARLSSKLYPQQNVKALEVDSRLRVTGANDIYAMGDCATLSSRKLLGKIREAFSQTEQTSLSFEQFTKVVQHLVDEVPESAVYLRKLRQVFETYDVDQNRALDLEELQVLLSDIDKKLTTLPATAQVARQQGEYLSQAFNTLAHPTVETPQIPPFQYRHLGSFSYVGGHNAVIEAEGRTGHGWGVFLLWRGAYLAKQVSLRTRILLGFDWVKSKFIGRDITRS